MAKAGEMKTGVACARRHVEHLRSRRERDVFERCGDIGDIRQNVRASVVAALPAELRLRRLAG